jgi:hypothetical protein
MGVFVVFVCVLQSMGFADQHGGIMLLLIAGFAGVALWWSSFKEYYAYHRRFSRLWIESFGKPPRTVTLASRDPELLEQIRRKSGRVRPVYEIEMT